MTNHEKSEKSKQERCAKRPLTPEAADAMRIFWWHMCKRIIRDANIQYYCGAMTETLRLAVAAYHALYPEHTEENLENRLIGSGISNDADILRLRNRVAELEDQVHP